jgi:hypothetical protein
MPTDTIIGAKLRSIDRSRRDNSTLGCLDLSS